MNDVTRCKCGRFISSADLVPIAEAAGLDLNNDAELRRLHTHIRVLATGCVAGGITILTLVAWYLA